MYVLFSCFPCSRFIALARLSDTIAGIVEYCVVVSYLTGLLPSPASRVPFSNGLLHLSAAIRSVYPSEECYSAASFKIYWRLHGNLILLPLTFIFSFCKKTPRW